jgi:hypothetical protein
MVGQIQKQDTSILVGMVVIPQNILAGGHLDHQEVVEAAEVAAGVVVSAVVVAVEDNI